MYEFVHAVVAAFPEHLVVAFVVWLRKHDGSEVKDSENFGPMKVMKNIVMKIVASLLYEVGGWS